MFRGGMGGGGSGSSVLRVVGRAVTRAGVTNLQEPISSSSASSSTTSPTAASRGAHKAGSQNNNSSLSLTSGSGSGYVFPACNVPVAAGSGGSASATAAYWPSFGGCEDHDWVTVDGFEEEKSFADDFVLGPVPSVDEVNGAVSALTQVLGTDSSSQPIGDKDVADQIYGPTGLMHQSSSFGATVDWIEPSLHLHNPAMLRPYGCDRVYDALYLLQTEPSVQRMVVSLSSDKAVWDAVLNNEVVRELRATYYADEGIAPLTADDSDETRDDSNPAIDFVKWIFRSTKAKLVEVFEKITKLVNELFKPHDDKNTAAGEVDIFQERVRTSVMLSIVVLLIVVVSRGLRA